MSFKLDTMYTVQLANKWYTYEKISRLTDILHFNYRLKRGITKLLHGIYLGLFT